MSKQSSIITVAFTKTSLRGRVMRAVMSRSDRMIENNKEGRSCQREFEGEENKMTPNERDVQEWKN